ncbi:leucyl/phenylalanyl-tRNA--protein transferase [Aquisalinus flavus]|uniref:Leucyl/phenylalanyl-tRNA--protein transferase n=1 Tax=Aquisalinus flavus TaxID=1526572 RepID=A0A8J2V4V8_9PROT|nr:leucyl/phenylalanyl-tRNA--protein transferase [Aquisalinus flavus]MBD0427462.1 leucyl/phenylalanyl-tRNA--protein transferase [Aquisalinus flavus]UNE47262.1 leucyl/phenylalanyl-tRNA--protein transferase [Aquisalinus flavus]GGD01204.1 leucyl/phenylalanyl-tRNA--protein transferase [Aquisalinus flavus]
MQSDSVRGSALSTEDLLKAYTLGYFPMSEAHDDPDVFWVLPEYRGVLRIGEFHIPKSLRKAVRQDRVDIRVDTAFRETMIGCAAPATGREETWINERILETYCALHRQGHAHSVEAWLDGELVGGLYGVSINGAFFGESMFSRVTDASKIALVHLVGRLRAGGYTLLDTQFYTPHLGQFGISEIPKARYQSLLDEALGTRGNFFALPRQIAGSTILQSTTQTS